MVILTGLYVVGGAPAANAFSLLPCHWNTTSPGYQNLGGTAFGAEVTTAVSKWVTSTDIVSMSTSTGAHFVIRYQNLGATGAHGVTVVHCTVGTTLDATSRINTYYTNSFSSARRMAVVVHEIGHGLGLGHSTNIGAIMYSCPACVYDNWGLNSPQPDDKNGMNSIY